MDRILNKCPKCGSKLQFSNLMQFTRDCTIREQGYSVMNPARILKCMPPDTTYKEFMQMSITMLKMCDQIYMLKGWEKSCGANQEYGYALACDMIIEREV